MQRKPVSEKQALKRLELSLDQKRELHDALRRALEEVCELEDVGELQLSLLLDALIQPMAKVYYNKGLSDARRCLLDRLDDISALEV